MTSVRLITQKLRDELLAAIKTSSSICILTSFAMKSGVELLLPALKQAVECGADIKILTGDYLYVTQPEALRLLYEADERIEIRLWRSDGVSFHPKAFLFQRQMPSEEGDGLLIIGSSNLSRSALTTGVEWNLAMEKSIAPDTFYEGFDRFLHLFYHEKTVPVNRVTYEQYRGAYESYHQQHPQFVRTWTTAEEISMTLPDLYTPEKDMTIIVDPAADYLPDTITPRFAQPEALQALEETLANGYSRAMVVMATGLGKTYLAAFFARKFRRVLFVAHREEILQQAMKSFRHVSPEYSSGLYNGREKVRDTDYVFASIHTLAARHHLEAFAPDEFDLIVIDEFHHAAAATYRRVLDYFTPAFLLGITATPDRLDGKDVFAICDGNVAYEIDFIEAVRRSWLAPFQYYGIYDDIDYSQIHWTGMSYDEEQLLQAQQNDELAQKIFTAWKKQKQTRTLAFCSSIGQADYLADYFRRQGISTLSLHSRTMEMTRAEAIKQLTEGTLDAIFTVDLFNEGVDIPVVDTLLFVRPTESLAIFVQQIGRGLRLFDGKSHCVIIDLIGNYRNADIKLSVFSKESRGKEVGVVPAVPASCGITLDTKVIDLIKEMAGKKMTHKTRMQQRMKEAYERVKEEFGRRPTYLEYYLNSGIQPHDLKRLFKGYFSFLNWLGELSDHEQEVLYRYQVWWSQVNETSMTKSYKMVVLHAMLLRGKEAWYRPITPIEAAPAFYQYLMGKGYRKQKDLSDKDKQSWSEHYSEGEVSRKIADMPMTKWAGSSNGLISFTGGRDGKFELHLSVSAEDQKLVFEWTKQICEFRLHTYFSR